MLRAQQKPAQEAKEEGTSGILHTRGLKPALQMPPPSAWGHKGTGERGLTQRLQGPSHTLLTAQGGQRL